MKIIGFSLRLKAIILVVITTTFLAIGLGVPSRQVILNSFIELENQQALADIKSSVVTVENEIDKLDSTNTDWAFWDDTYQYVINSNQEYLDNNLMNQTFVNLNINLFLLVSNEGKIIYEKEYDLDTRQTIPAPDTLEDYFRAHSEVLIFPDFTSVHKGVWLFNGKLWMVSIRPVLTSKMEGPSSAALIIARQLNAREIRQVSEVNHNDVQIQAYNHVSLPEDFSSIRNRFTEQQRFITQPLSENKIAAYSLVNDIFGDPAIIIRVDGSRDIYQQGTQTITIFTLLLIITSLLWGGIIVLGLNRQILRRIEHLYQSLEKIGESGNLSMRVDLKGKDELASLARRFNETLDALQFSKKALRENQDRLQHDAKHDVLTGFFNRAYFNEKLTDVIEQNIQPLAHINAVLLTDLDEFKYINDSFDHEIGDKFLVAFGQRLKHCLRANDLVARLGGDEFSVLLENISSRSEAIQVAQRIQYEMRTPFETGGQKIFMTVSIGIAFTENDMRPEDLMRNADMALYHAKANGKARYEIFDHAMHSLSMNRLQLETALRHAIEQNQFVVYYQPIISLESGKIISLEALVRWQNPGVGLCSPGEFIALAEETGLIIPLGEFVLHTALQQLKTWMQNGYPNLHMAVNVSARQLQSELFLNFVRAELEINGVPGENLEIEITESVMFTKIERTLTILEQLKQLGISFSIDDFGTGYSSLAYLKRFPVSCIKIDQSFISSVMENIESTTIVTAVIAIGKALDLKIIAEGIERPEQYHFLLERNCENGQGYLFSRPVPHQQITELLSKGGIIVLQSQSPSFPNSIPS